jgi:predicted lysophospholipase L1 biosynthesis ABC-type transport system permease subunit
MSKLIEFPLKRELAFPERCVCCGKPSEAEIPMTINHRKRSVSLKVPLCLRCKKSDQHVFLSSLLTFVIGLVSVGVACFVLLFIWEGKTRTLESLGINNVPGHPNAEFVLLGGTSFLIGIAAGFLLEAIAKVLFIPFLGRALYYAPLMAVQFLGNIEYVAGLRVSLSENAKALRLKFYNEEVAVDFERLNS